MTSIIHLIEQQGAHHQPQTRIVLTERPWGWRGSQFQMQPLLLPVSGTRITVLSWAALI